MAEVRQDIVTQGPLDRLAALLDRPPFAVPPPLAHWLFTLPDARQSALGPDGHPTTGLVPSPPGRPRRMWAGSRLRFPGELAVGDRLERHSEVVSTVDKPGLTLVTVRQEIRANGTLAVVEEQDLAFLPARDAPDTAPARRVEVPAPDRVQRVTADAAMLFRFSALTFNAHRIHYDRDYARVQEHYPGLVVHGPLLALLLLEHGREGRAVAGFDFRARAPVFDGEMFELCAAGTELWVRRGDTVAMTASVRLA